MGDKMVYEKEKLDKMSNHEINVAVAKKYFKPEEFIVTDTSYYKGYHFKEDEEFVALTIDGSEDTEKFDPCNDWNDIMTIAMKNQIAPRADYRMVKGYTSDGHVYESYNENPMRAMCEVFLMMEIKDNEM